MLLHTPGIFIAWLRQVRVEYAKAEGEDTASGLRAGIGPLQHAEPLIFKQDCLGLDIGPRSCEQSAGLRALA